MRGCRRRRAGGCGCRRGNRATVRRETISYGDSPNTARIHFGLNITCQGREILRCNRIGSTRIVDLVHADDHPLISRDRGIHPAFHRIQRHRRILNLSVQGVGGKRCPVIACVNRAGVRVHLRNVLKNRGIMPTGAVGVGKSGHRQAGSLQIQLALTEFVVDLLQCQCIELDMVDRVRTDLPAMTLQISQLGSPRIGQPAGDKKERTRQSLRLKDWKSCVIHRGIAIIKSQRDKCRSRAIWKSRG